MFANKNESAPAGGLHFLVHEPDELFEEFQVFRPGDLANLADKVTSSLDQVDTTLNPEFFQRSSWTLHVEQFLDFIRVEFGCPVFIPFEPTDEIGESGTFVQ